jgi:hypothetical protein
MQHDRQSRRGQSGEQPRMKKADHVGAEAATCRRIVPKGVSVRTA